MKHIPLSPEKLVTGLKQILVFEGDAPVIEPEFSRMNVVSNGALLIEGGKIKAVGPREKVPREAGSGVRHIDLEKLSVVAAPGFVDSHTHALFAGLRYEEYEMRCQGRSYEEIHRAGGGILSTVRRVRGMSEEDLLECSRLHVARFLEFGTTTVEIKSGYGLDAESELKMLRVIGRLQRELPLDIVPTYLGAHAVPPGRTAEAYVEEILQLLPRIQEEKLALYVDAFCEKGFFTPEQTRRIFRAAVDNGFLLKLHADQLSNAQGGEIAAEFGCVSADHLEHVSEAGLEAMAASGTIATLLPGAAFFLGKSYPSWQRIAGKQVPVALATDFNPGTCFTQNMQIILTIACSQMKMTPAQAFNAATFNGAAALRLDNVLGSLRAGKNADIALFGVEDYRQIPYEFGVNHCIGVLKGGELFLPGDSPIGDRL